jgi:hypothetical protein
MRSWAILMRSLFLLTRNRRLMGPVQYIAFHKLMQDTVLLAPNVYETTLRSTWQKSWTPLQLITIRHTKYSFRWSSAKGRMAKAPVYLIVSWATCSHGLCYLQLGGWMSIPFHDIWYHVSTELGNLKIGLTTPHDFHDFHMTSMSKAVGHSKLCEASVYTCLPRS